MLHAISLAAILFGLWLLLSGHFTPYLLTIGGMSTILTVAIAMRMDVVDHESHPVHLGFRLLTYWPWLGIQVLLGNIQVTRSILTPSMPIAPQLLTLRASQKTVLGQVIHANSITLTPGTATIELDKGEILVHALTTESAEFLRQGKMDRRVSALEKHK